MEIRYMKKELLKDLTDEQIAKVKACKSQEEIIDLAKKEGIELTNEQLEAVNGGGCMTYTVKCPKCGSNIIVKNGKGKDYHCNNCGHEFDDSVWEDVKGIFN